MFALRMHFFFLFKASFRFHIAQFSFYTLVFTCRPWRWWSYTMWLFWCATILLSLSSVLLTFYMILSLCFVYTAWREDISTVTDDFLSSLFRQSYPVMLTRPEHSRPRPTDQGQGHPGWEWSWYCTVTNGHG